MRFYVLLSCRSSFVSSHGATLCSRHLTTSRYATALMWCKHSSRSRSTTWKSILTAWTGTLHCRALCWSLKPTAWYAAALMWCKIPTTYRARSRKSNIICVWHYLSFPWFSLFLWVRLLISYPQLRRSVETNVEFSDFRKPHIYNNAWFDRCF